MNQPVFWRDRNGKKGKRVGQDHFRHCRLPALQHCEQVLAVCTHNGSVCLI
jgi:hypothetical protein